eukprot:6936026-Alexandrium_andersonii.AAC.1
MGTLPQCPESPGSGPSQLGDQLAKPRGIRKHFGFRLPHHLAFQALARQGCPQGLPQASVGEDRM